MAKYTNASAAEALAEETVIPRYKPFLKDYKIGYVEVDSMSSKGVTTWAKIKKCSPLEKHLSDYDILVLINREVWHRLTDRQKIALLHHEFCHTGENDAGDLVMLPHDLEEFGEVVKEHGLWRPAVDGFAAQLTLNLNEGAVQPRAWLDPHGTGGGKVPVMEKAVSKVTITGNGRTVELTDDEFGAAARSLDLERAAAVDDTLPPEGTGAGELDLPEATPA